MSKFLVAVSVFAGVSALACSSTPQGPAGSVTKTDSANVCLGNCESNLKAASSACSAAREACTNAALTAASAANCYPVESTCLVDKAYGPAKACNSSCSAADGATAPAVAQLNAQLDCTENCDKQNNTCSGALFANLGACELNLSPPASGACKSPNGTDVTACHDAFGKCLDQCK